MAGPCVLDVERSLTGRRWTARTADDRIALAICQRLTLPDMVGRVLAGRGVALDQAEGYLRPRLRELLPDPFHLRDMDRAAERLARAVIAGERIAVFGDYDVDGATSSALLDRFFRMLGAEILVHIPDRRTEGYGPNGPALRALREKGAAVVVTVDCGITAFSALAEARAVGLDVVVLDHHKAEPVLPEALAVVDPNRLDEDSPCGHLAAVGLAFLLAVAVNGRLRATDFFAGRPEPDLMSLLDLVALGTVCDVVPLTGVNRAFVAQGLKVMARRGNLGLAALADVARMDRPPEAFHLGFLLGPRVNAGGRVGEAPLGWRLLATDDPEEARILAERLDRHNAARKEIEEAVMLAAIRQVEGRAPRGVVVAFGDDWHPGVLGIVAGRLRERYQAPALAICVDGALATGSGRSVPGFDIGAAVIAARESGILEKGGGHPMAAGFTLATARLPAFEAFLIERLASGEALAPSCVLDGLLQPRGADTALVRALAQAGPFGSGNEEPRFALPAVRVAKADIVGSGHVRAFIGDASGARLKAMAFRAADDEIGHALLGGRSLHLAGSLRIDAWQGREEVVLSVEDAAYA